MSKNTELPDPLQQAEDMLRKFAEGRSLLLGVSDEPGADGRAVLAAAVQIALAYEVRTAATMIVDPLHAQTPGAQRRTV